MSLLIARLLLATVIAGHGAQKLFGWFGGFGFDATITFFTSVLGLPYLVALLIIVVESVGMVALALGLLSRAVSVTLILIMLGAIATTHADHGFFMNWFSAQAGEGYEYHVLVIALSLLIAINGSGALSVHAYLKSRVQSNSGKASVILASLS